MFGGASDHPTPVAPPEAPPPGFKNTHGHIGGANIPPLTAPQGARVEAVGEQAERGVQAAGRAAVLQGVEICDDEFFREPRFPESCIAGQRRAPNSLCLQLPVILRSPYRCAHRACISVAVVGSLRCWLKTDLCPLLSPTADHGPHGRHRAHEVRRAGRAGWTYMFV
jgi:hypothetical protein